jgi:hypothetical protein
MRNNHTGPNMLAQGTLPYQEWARVKQHVIFLNDKKANIRQMGDITIQ